MRIYFYNYNWDVSAEKLNYFVFTFTIDNYLKQFSRQIFS